MKFGSLFAGIGGIDLGLERAGMTCSWQVEIDDYASKVLQKHWPDVTRFRDVRDCGKHNLEKVDLVAGGFPCQPVSQNGNGAGERDPRWLWPEFLRIIRDLVPKWILVENVPGLLSNNYGRSFAGVLRDLAGCGYNAEWNSIQASTIGAYHKRKRVFLVAYTDEQQPGLLRIRPKREWRHLLARGNYPSERREENREKKKILSSCAGGARWAIEPELARLVHGIPVKMDRIRRRMLGNAVVPQIAEWIGRRIMQLSF